MEPIVDINIAVYNQASYLRQTLDGVLEQKTDFSYRLLIGDDCSTDGSVDILKEYEKNYPDKIKVIYQSKNLGLHSPERNGIILLKNSTAKYIALLDGDDYWIDPNKLQTQIDFLENHLEYVGCFHNTEERYEESEKSSFLYCNYPIARSISFGDLSYGNVIPTCSIVYRNNLFAEFPNWYSRLQMGDWTLHLLNAQFGNYWYIPKVMAVHRLHMKSVWMLQDADRNNQFVIDAYEAMIKWFAHNKIYAQQLTKAKELFKNSIRSEDYKWTVKRKIKNALIRLIEKL